MVSILVIFDSLNLVKEKLLVNPLVYKYEILND